MDLVIGSAFNLTWNQCKYWANSLNRSGFEGDKVIVIFGDNQDLVNKFKENNFEVYNLRALNIQEHICAARFFVYYAILQERANKYKKVIATDVTDVVFQRNPSEFFKDYWFDCIISSSENIKYKDEVWGAQNVKLAFGEAAYDKVKDNVIYNAGVIAGTQEYLKDLFFSIHMLCESRSQHVPGGGAPDQAAYNILLSTSPYKAITKFIDHDIGWACQVGTVADPYKNYSHVNVSSNPLFKNGIVTTSYDREFYIVHQYNRNPAWREIIERKYS